VASYTLCGRGLASTGFAGRQGCNCPCLPAWRGRHATRARDTRHARAPPRPSPCLLPGPAGGRWRCVAHLAGRCRLQLALLDSLDMLGRTAELARTFGIDFTAVVIRGSQYRCKGGWRAWLGRLVGGLDGQAGWRGRLAGRVGEGRGAVVGEGGLAWRVSSMPAGL
jgi:hypothetical protein